MSPKDYSEPKNRLWVLLPNIPVRVFLIVSYLPLKKTPINSSHVSTNQRLITHRITKKHEIDL
jgi:hypothetical protein